MISWSGIYHILATPFTDAGDASARVRPSAPALDRGTLDELAEILSAVGA